MKQKQPRIVVCERCGKRFEASSNRQKYCSPSCAAWMNQYKAAERQRQRNAEKRGEKAPRYCVRCGIELPCECIASRKYCDDCKGIVSREYSRAYKAQRAEEQRNLGGHHKRKLHAFTCDMCGAQAQSYGHNARYCERCKKRKQHNMNVAFIGKRDGREVFERVCVTCGLPFSTFFEDHEECAPCMKGANAAKKAKTAKPVIPLAEQMRIIEAYNREHGTSLSYGKYMAMIGGVMG